MPDGCPVITFFVAPAILTHYLFSDMQNLKSPARLAPRLVTRIKIEVAMYYFELVIICIPGNQTIITFSDCTLDKIIMRLITDNPEPHFQVIAEGFKKKH
jgi:hypothetical protein